MLRPTFLGFETAKSALRISQMGLDTVGHNISNVSTEGYTRQRVDQVSVSSTYRTKYQIYGALSQFSGQGVRATGINQIRDPYLDARYRSEAAAYGELAVKAGGLTELEDIFDEISTTGLYAVLGDFINELTKFEQQPDSMELAVVVRSAAESVVNVFNQYAGQLSAALEQQKYDLNVAINQDINGTLEQIAYLNERIREANMYGDPANELNDTRNMLIDQLSEYLPIKVLNEPETLANGTTIDRLSIVLVDSTSSGSNYTLVDNNKYNLLGWSEDPQTGEARVNLVETGTGYVLADISENIVSGGIKGYLDIINGKGDFAGSGENTYRGIPYYQSYLDVFARSFADLMNRINSISFEEAQGKEVITEFQNKNLFTAKDGSYDNITAASISVSAEWYNNPQFLTVSKEDPTYEAETDDEGNIIYDTQGEPVYKLSSKSDNVMKFVAGLTGKGNYFYGVNGNGERFSLYNGSYQECLVSMQGTLGLDASLNQSLLKASYTVVEGYAGERESISAVNIDEEAINMMVFQNYYNAAARYMTVLDEALGTIIQSMGVVGR